MKVVNQLFFPVAAARTLRTISFIEGLQVLVTALIDTIRNSVLNVVILLTMLMAFFAVVGYYIFGYDEDTGDKENWGTLSTAMLTLFTFVTVSNYYLLFLAMRAHSSNGSVFLVYGSNA